MSYLGAGADWRKRNYLIEPDAPTCVNTGALNRISDALFNERWPGGVIDFTQYAIATPNPTFTPAQYGAVGLFQPYVSCASYFVPQTYLPPGQMTGLPAFPLVLDIDGPGTFIANDTARLPNPTTCLSGSPFLNGSASFLVTEADFVTPKPVVGVSVNIGFFNAVGTCRVRAYDSAANLLGTGFNLTRGGFENFTLNRDSNVPIIAAITLENLGDVAGMTYGDIRFSNECA